jgi:hypothetical protein
MAFRHRDEPLNVNCRAAKGLDGFVRQPIFEAGARWSAQKEDLTPIE